MIIKKYVADTMNEALNLIKFEMGQEAIIVSKRMVKQKGLLGFFFSKRVEVTAAIDENRKNENTKNEGQVEIKKDNEKDEIGQELNEVKEMLRKLVVNNKEKKEKRLGIKKLLIEKDVSEEVLSNIISTIKRKEEYKNVSRLPDCAVIDEISNLIHIDEETEGRVHAFIGPTGVGKTTTIAKLAAIKSLNTGKKVGLITIDTYRIGAVEQLKIYADILGLPFEVINSTNDIEKSLDNLKDCDYIFVDTTGRSIKNVMQLSELKLYLDRIKPHKTYLVVSMTTKYHDLLQILNVFDSMNYNSIILTKFDETTTYGSLMNVAFFSKAPISYISVGQNVPDDIENATRERLLALVIGEESI